jgi:DNA-binding CsgD family transcriptional regulator
MGGPAQGRLAAGERALETGDWDGAAAHFGAAALETDDADAYAGLGSARWWLGDVEGAFEARTLAYRALRREGRLAESASTAAWLAREHRRIDRDVVVADGWLSRARTVADLAGDAAVRGWVDLAAAEAAGSLALVREAVGAARRTGDADLEIVALARAAVMEVMAGEVEDGIAHADEAMVAAIAGEGRDPQSVGEACCALVEIAELLGDPERFGRWAEIVVGYRSSHAFPPLTARAHGSLTDVIGAFCGACCGGVLLISGRLDEAEGEILAAIQALGGGRAGPRCVHPVIQLAELRVAQGRVEEAAVLLEEVADLPESVRPMAAVDLASGSPGRAAGRLRVGAAALADRPVVAFPLRLLLVDAELAAGDLPAADAAAIEAARIASMTGSRRHAAAAEFAVAKVATARGEPEGASMLRAASARLAAAGLGLESSRARLAYARACLPGDRDTATIEAAAALTAFERVGAGGDADAASEFLRLIGVRGRTGRKRPGRLSDREVEVLRLVSIGLSDAEIGERLHISRKTVGHHVSSILAKLDVRSRTEAAAYSVLHVFTEPAAE